MTTRLFHSRGVAAGDRDVFKDLTAKWVGLPCSAWRKSYGRTGHLHFGELRPKTVITRNTVYKDEGEWVLDLLDCDRTVRVLPEHFVSSSTHGDDAVFEILPSLVGKTLTKVVLDDTSLGLELMFGTNILLSLSIDHGCPPDSEQWNVFDAMTDIVAYADYRWGVFRRGDR